MIAKRIGLFVLVVFSYLGASVEEGDVLIGSKQALFDEAYSKIFVGHSFGNRIYKKESTRTGERGFSVRQSHNFSDYALQMGICGAGAISTMLLVRSVEKTSVALILKFVAAGLCTAAIAQIIQALSYDDLLVFFPTGLSLYGGKFITWDDIQHVEYRASDKKINSQGEIDTAPSTVHFVFSLIGGIELQCDHCPQDIAPRVYDFINEMTKQTMLLRVGAVDYE